jgi:ribose transport system substrate-binding protein
MNGHLPPERERPAVSSSRLAVLTTALALALTACSGMSAAPAPTKSPVDYSAQALQATQAAISGTYHEPSSQPRPAARNKKLAVISSGQNAISSLVPASAVMEAAATIGWDAKLYDGKLDPKSWPGLVSQAVADGVAGIVLVAVDCPAVAKPLAEAKAKGIKIVGIFAFDCNDVLFGGTAPSLFSSYVDFGPPVNQNIADFSQLYGADQANTVIAQTDGKAKVILVTDNEFTSIRHTIQGFRDTITKCTTCSIVAEVDIKAADLTTPAAAASVLKVLQEHPDANAVKSPYTAATLAAVSPAVMKSGRAASLYVMGGEGFEPELDLIRKHEGLSAVTVIPSDWYGWAAVDTVNSLFIGQEPADSGLGWQLIDDEVNPPSNNAYKPTIDFRSAYRAAWGRGD